MSSLKGSGIPALLDDLRQLVGEHGDVWVVGAQNSGATMPKSCQQPADAVQCSLKATAEFEELAWISMSCLLSHGIEGLVTLLIVVEPKTKALLYIFRL